MSATGCRCVGRGDGVKGVTANRGSVGVSDPASALDPDVWQPRWAMRGSLAVCRRMFRLLSVRVSSRLVLTLRFLSVVVAGSLVVCKSTPLAPLPVPTP